MMSLRSINKSTTIIIPPPQKKKQTKTLPNYYYKDTDNGGGGDIDNTINVRIISRSSQQPPLSIDDYTQVVVLLTKNVAGVFFCVVCFTFFFK